MLLGPGGLCCLSGEECVEEGGNGVSSVFHQLPGPVYRACGLAGSREYRVYDERDHEQERSLPCKSAEHPYS